jgi:hypothetical protein
MDGQSIGWQIASVLEAQPSGDDGRQFIGRSSHFADGRVPNQFKKDTSGLASPCSRPV